MARLIHISSTHHTRICQIAFILAAFLLSAISNLIYAKSYKLAIQPILSEERTIRFYQPLADYLSNITGHDIQIHTSPNFVSYWEELRTNNKYDLALDAAHFTDYRNKRFHYSVLAKITDTISFSLITNEDVSFFDAGELVGHRIATPASPSVAGVRLLDLFPNSMRQPVLIGTNDFGETLKKLKSKTVEAALVPTSIINGDSSVNTILVTEPIPHMALSVSPRIDNETRSQIQSALLKAGSTKEGKELFNKLNLPGFEKADNNIYAGFDELLHSVWGYQE